MGQNYIKNGLSKTENEILYPCKATYYITPDGTKKLARIEEFTRPVFKPLGWEEDEKEERKKKEKRTEGENPENRERAYRRATIRCMDIVACNPFDWFCTLTISPEKMDRKSYSDIEKAFSTWASNRVQRNELRYVAVPEYHKDGESIHLHMLTNDVLKLADSGVRQEGKAVYNLTDWRHGFSTAKRITGENAQIACAKYCLKYMRKQQGQKIGGRYFLTGGMMRKPILEYGDSPEDFKGADQEIKYQKEIAQEWGKYRLKSYV